MLACLKSLPENAVVAKVTSPVGDLWLFASQKGLHAVLFGQQLDAKSRRAAVKSFKDGEGHPVIRKACKQLQEYFNGYLRAFDLPLVLEGTPFQKKAWNQLRKIPYGQTVTYNELSQKMGEGKKPRAVGAANGHNPISIIVPCHRVVSKNGDLRGFGGGIHAKEHLLTLEKKFADGPDHGQK